MQRDESYQPEPPEFRLKHLAVVTILCSLMLSAVSYLSLGIYGELLSVFVVAILILLTTWQASDEASAACVWLGSAGVMLGASLGRTILEDYTQLLLYPIISLLCLAVAKKEIKKLDARKGQDWETPVRHLF